MVRPDHQQTERQERLQGEPGTARFIIGRDPDGSLRTKPCTVVSEGCTFDKRLDRILLRQDVWPELGNPCPLVTFHHHQHRRFCPDGCHGDNTSWLEPMGKAKDYYLPFLSLFVAHHVLFEDFDGGETDPEGLAAFRAEAVDLALSELERTFGPVAVRLPWRPEPASYPAGPD